MVDVPRVACGVGFGGLAFGFGFWGFGFRVSQSGWPSVRVTCGGRLEGCHGVQPPASWRVIRSNVEGTLWESWGQPSPPCPGSRVALRWGLKGFYQAERGHSSPVHGADTLRRLKFSEKKCQVEGAHGSFRT